MNWLKLFSLIVLLSGCASFGMGQRQCTSVDLPVRPSGELCIANPDGSAECFDERRNPSSYHKPSVVNHVCFSGSEYTTQEEWMKSVIEACKR